MTYEVVRDFVADSGPRNFRFNIKRMPEEIARFGAIADKA